jgi:hypothetical protein
MCSLCSLCEAQQDAHLRELTKQVISLRGANKKSRENLAEKMGKSPIKIVLMDEIRQDANEYVGKDAFLFWLNQIVANVYSQQHVMLVSKGEYYNSTEKGIYYSAIEKSVQSGKTVSYQITGHIGNQEYVILSFHPDSKFKVSVKLNGSMKIQSGEIKGQWSFTLPQVKVRDMMTLQITSLSPVKNKNDFESFAILNFNPQK